MFLGIPEMIEGVKRVIENALGSTLLDIAIQIGATLFLVIIVKVFFWSKITAFLQKRRELMDEEFSSAKQANEEAKALQEKSEKEYKDIKAKSKDYIEKAKLRGEEEREVIVSKAKEEAKGIITQAEQEITLEKQKAKTDIQKEAVNLATIMASKIIEKEIDDGKYQDLVVENLERSEKV
ncbi:F0F1 ATP synthase subunit B [Candidatus Izemoplasma sp. B36]|uniref:F0F1 ATP synthase subunit B n=1 Tax=Candidatus Izemoplasma sp. B36 TaxID=3242468 RepID=UPI003557445B